MTYDQCMASCNVSRATIAKTVKLFASDGIDEALKINRNINSNAARRKVDGRTEAKIIAIACGPIPQGHTHWTIRLLEERMKIELDEPISREAIRRSLKNQLRPHRSDYWCLPNRADAEFVACMEDMIPAKSKRGLLLPKCTF